MYTIHQLTLDQQSRAGGREVRVMFDNGQTYTIADAGGDPTFQNVAGTLTADELNQNLALHQALNAVGEFYRFWLSGNEDPMVLMLRKDTPVLHELYESEETSTAPDGKLVGVGKDYAYALACSIFCQHKDPDAVKRTLIYEDDAKDLLRAARQAGLSDALPIVLGSGEEEIELSMNEKGFYFLTQLGEPGQSDDEGVDTYETLTITLNELFERTLKQRYTEPVEAVWITDEQAEAIRERFARFVKRPASFPIGFTHKGQCFAVRKTPGYGKDANYELVRTSLV